MKNVMYAAVAFAAVCFGLGASSVGVEAYLLSSDGEHTHKAVPSHSHDDVPSHYHSEHEIY